MNITQDKTRSVTKIAPTQQLHRHLLYVKRWQSNHGLSLTIRVIRPEDEEKMVQFHSSLSDATVYMRYFHPMKLSKRISHARLARICSIDYDKEMVLVAEKSSGGGEKAIIGVSRLNLIGDGEEGEVALVISDPYHCQGIGSEMIRCLIEIAREKKMSLIYADILPGNRPARTLFRNLGFQIIFEHDEGIVRAKLRLAAQ